MAIDEETKKQTRDPLSVKVKPKRGKSSRKQKQRLAIKLDKVLLHPQINSCGGVTHSLCTLHMSKFGLLLHCNCARTFQGHGQGSMLKYIVGPCQAGEGLRCDWRCRH